MKIHILFKDNFQRWGGGVMFKRDIFEGVKSYGSSAPVIPSFHMSGSDLVWKIPKIKLHFLGGSVPKLRVWICMELVEQNKRTKQDILMHVNWYLPGPNGKTFSLGENIQCPIKAGIYLWTLWRLCLRPGWLITKVILPLDWGEWISKFDWRRRVEGELKAGDD